MKENAKVVKTLYSMMRDRGYSTSPQLKHQMYIFSADSLPTIEIRLFQEDKIGIGHMKNFVHPKTSPWDRNLNPGTAGGLVKVF